MLVLKIILKYLVQNQKKQTCAFRRLNHSSPKNVLELGFEAKVFCSANDRNEQIRFLHVPDIQQQVEHVAHLCLRVHSNILPQNK